MEQLKKLLAGCLLAICLTVSGATGVVFNSGVITSQASGKISLEKTKLTINKSGRTVLTLKNVKKTQKVTWSISNSNIAAISAKNNVVTITGKKAGTVKITAKCGGKKYICNLTVANKPRNIGVSAYTLNVSRKAVLNIYSASGVYFYYSYPDSSYFSCSLGKWKNGLTPLTITGKKSGTTKIIVTNNKNDEKIIVTLKIKL